MRLWMELECSPLQWMDKKVGTSLLIEHKTDEKGNFRQSECLIGDF